MTSFLPLFPSFFVFVAIAVFVLSLFGNIFIDIFNSWKRDFRLKLPRCHMHSPSNKCPPTTKSLDESVHSILSTSNHATESMLLRQLRNKNGKDKRTVFNRESSPLYYKDKIRVDNFAEKLDMNHIYLSFSQFLWCQLFVGIPLVFNAIKGISVLVARVICSKLHLIAPESFDPASIVAKLCLETMIAINYLVKNDKDKHLVGFFYPKFPIIKQDGDVYIADLLEIVINTSQKKMVHANLDNVTLTASQALTLCWFNVIATNHVKIHSLANWGVNVDICQDNLFLYRNSLATVVFNHYGYQSFTNYFYIYKKFGLLDKNWNAEAMKVVFDHGINENIQAHPDIGDLYKHSRLVKFIVLVRPMFLKKFSKFKNHFPGIDAEALFAGTILHSLDHIMAERCLEDPLWLDVEDEKFGMMAQVGRIVRAAFVSDLQGIYFNKRYKDSVHPFYRSVYEGAYKVDAELADHMDTCIIK